MCKVIKMQARGKSFKVADIKQECVENIIDAASTCDSIDKIILFGSSITNKCKKDSDVDKMAEDFRRMVDFWRKMYSRT